MFCILFTCELTLSNNIQNQRINTQVVFPCLPLVATVSQSEESKGTWLNAA